MTDVRFLSNNSVICEVNHVKFKTIVQGIVKRIKAPKNCINSQRIHPCGANLYQKVEITNVLGLRTHPRASR